jgi:hypothetical protein
VRQAVQVRAPSEQEGLYEIVTVAYQYNLKSPDGREVISFHWNRLAVPPERPYPHIHIGSVVAAGSPILPDRFNKIHIPSGPISLASVVGFAIEELSVDVLPGRNRTQVLQELAHLEADWQE